LRLTHLARLQQPGRNLGILDVLPLYTYFK
jgi:hypothetical protein